MLPEVAYLLATCRAGVSRVVKKLYVMASREVTGKLVWWNLSLRLVDLF